MENNLKTRYTKTIKAELQKKLGSNNSMAVPSVTKIIVNMGVKDAVADKKNVERAASAMTQITGQKPKIIRARKSISTFKLRQGDQIGVAVTLRGERMYAFLEKIIAIVLPRIRDFRGMSRKSFDGRGNYTIGFTEHAVFPEIDQATAERLQGLEVVIVTNAKNNEEGMTLLEAMGMPFHKIDR